MEYSLISYSIMEMHEGVGWIKSEANNVLDAKAQGGNYSEDLGWYADDYNDEDGARLTFWEASVLRQTYYLLAASKSWKG